MHGNKVLLIFKERFGRKEVNIINSHRIPFFNLMVPVLLIWMTIVQVASVDNYLVNGTMILICPIIEIVLVIYYCLTKNKRLLKYSLLPIIFLSYVIIRHCTNGDIWSHGSSDIFIYALCLFCLLSYNKEEFIQRFYLFCFTSLIISFSVALISYIVPSDISGINSERMKGIFAHPNIFGHWVAYGLIFGIGAFLINPQNKATWILLPLDGLITLKVLIDTESRASMLFVAITLFCSIIAYFAYWKKTLSEKQRKVISFIILGIITLFIILVVVFCTYTPFRSFILDILRVNYSDINSLSNIVISAIEGFKDGSSRDDLRNVAIEEWKGNVLFGTSTNNIVTAMNTNLRSADASHNSFIQILASLGLVGFIPFILFFISGFIFMLYGAIKVKDKAIKTIAIFLTIIYLAITVDVTFENYLYTAISIMTISGYFTITAGYQIRNIMLQEKDVNPLL